MHVRSFRVVLAAGLTMLTANAFASYSSEVQPVAGTILFGPERMSFNQCGNGALTWISGDSWSAEGWSEVMAEIDSQPLCDLGTVPCRAQVADVIGLARIRTGGGFGHVNKYDREVTFTEVALVRGGDVCAM